MPRDKSEVRIKDFEKPIIYNISIPHKYNYTGCLKKRYGNSTGGRAS
jgi:hypothetical protein